MRINLKCSCGAEAVWENDNDSEAGTMHMIDLTDRWLIDHAKCREAAQVLTPGPDGVIGKVNISKLPRREPNFAFPNDQKDRPNPEKGCEHYPLTDLRPVEKALMTSPCPKCGKPIPKKGL